MSYDLDLLDPITREVIVLKYKHEIQGGIYRLGGNDEATLNITYNYSPHYYKHFGELGIRTIYGKTGAESIPILQDVIDKLGDDISDDYWEPTEGNAKKALLGLLALASIRPDGVWSGD